MDLTWKHPSFDFASLEIELVLDFIQRIAYLDGILHHQYIYGSDSLKFHFESTEDRGNQRLSIALSEFLKVLDVAWQHIQECFSLTRRHCFDQELLILRKKEKAATPSAIIGVPALISFEYLLSIHHRMQRLYDIFFFDSAQGNDFSEHITVVEFHTCVHFH